ncbi:asparagine synthetase A [Petrocella atlantisensis]|uniref:Aspartate--ammonia ligase n=2 Tax=Petrocella atlantisensis TaxID=2173034 RepID=A0A3P7NVD8_9FIRM|nr:aspartate--ammonia ligase [Petrocella atlantisensis]VDN46845.1 asparagine synthetase A [Petrocella atlantisensis]
MEQTMENLIIPNGYKTDLDIKETEKAIKLIKDFFERDLARQLKLSRVSAPLFVRPETGMNDNLNGVERPVSFEVKAIGDKEVEIVHSLAKWKRMALKRYRFEVNEGLYTDMNAIRRDEETDNLHSIYVDQWDWEKIIHKEDRNETTLRDTVNNIYKIFKDTEALITRHYPSIDVFLPEGITFMTTQELEDLYPDLTPKEREDRITKEKKAVFLMQIGQALNSGERHDGRAPDYDDWTLNGDILFWYPLLERAFELSSMGIRVDEEALNRQLELSGCEDRRKYPFHQALLNGELPYTMGGGIGQSRLCMYFLRKAHIGEVQSSIWPDEMIKLCGDNNIMLL